MHKSVFCEKKNKHHWTKWNTVRSLSVLSLSLLQSFYLIVITIKKKINFLLNSNCQVYNHLSFILPTLMSIFIWFICPSRIWCYHLWPTVLLCTVSGSILTKSLWIVWRLKANHLALKRNRLYTSYKLMSSCSRECIEN